jgi:hypothetical protein
MSNESEKTKCYTYQITMVVQVLAGHLAKAAEQLDLVGGHITSRKVELLNTTEIATALDKTESDQKLKTKF